MLHICFLLLFSPMIHLFCIYKSLVLQWIGHFLKIGYRGSMTGSIPQQGVDKLQLVDWLPSPANNGLLARSHTR